MIASSHRRRGATQPASPIASASEAVADGSAIEPAIDAAADRAAADAAVLPEPTLVAQAGGPMPIVTASPILAVEPSAVDVLKAQDAAVDRAPGQIDPLLGEPDPGLAAAGQPTLTINRAPGDAPMDDGSDLPGRSERSDLPYEEVFAAARGRIDARGGVPNRVTVIEVVGPAQGRRRAGFAFGTEPRHFRREQLTDEQLAALRADRLLTVGISEIDIDAALFPAG